MRSPPEERPMRAPKGTAYSRFNVYRTVLMPAVAIITLVDLYLRASALPEARAEVRPTPLAGLDVERPAAAALDGTPPPSPPAGVASPHASTASAAAAAAAVDDNETPRRSPLSPSFSDDSDCRRPYDRPGRGNAFAWCGESSERSSCCRSAAGVTCSYLANDQLCQRYFASEGGDAEGGGGGDGGGEGGGDGAAADAAPRDATADDGVGSDPQAEGARSDTAALEGGSRPRPRPMIEIDRAAPRRPRLKPYPQFNLTWTRGDKPPHADSWRPSEGQRSRLPARDLKEAYHRSCAVVGSSGNLRRSGYGPYIDAHDMVMRFNGAPAGGGYGADVGSRTTMLVLADLTASECVDGKAKQPTLSSARNQMVGMLLLEPSPGWRHVTECDFYPGQSPAPAILFLPRRGGLRRLVDYTMEHRDAPIYIRSDAFGEEVDSQVPAYQDDSSHPTSGFNGVNLALHICETVDIYGFGSHREKFFSPPRQEKPGSQHLYRTEMRWLLGLEQRFPQRVKVW